MKKLFTVFTFLLLILVLIGCTDSVQEAPVEVQNIVITGNILEAELHIQDVTDDLDIIKEIAHESIYKVFENYKTDFEGIRMKLYFEVIINDISLGIIYYDLNRSIEEPGLVFNSDTLAL
ncbi:Uncharacterised protein [Acholeplasma oculi]|uniref:Lipoprotein n=1 Tax=Acholeplasma oculi TaxID=35623 RepID=A0A061ABM3_9MOLU|nr:hypothetical protein [Acholeplasma oculi]CDR30809.1 hypothetical protein Aocu_07360 [Acholeplasma oculi]SKC35065.1 hypothetical protein SAMN02745122_0161 [Acholeplasma oculi]SUT89797.1 Uncharacterised protein [Acholeplasma oculi]